MHSAEDQRFFLGEHLLNVGIRISFSNVSIDRCLTPHMTRAVYRIAVHVRR
jgi:hypothetical protein